MTEADKTKMIEAFKADMNSKMITIDFEIVKKKAYLDGYREAIINVCEQINEFENDEKS